MSDAVEVTSSTLEALADQYRSIAHNLANVSTTAYKRRLSVFSQSLLEQMQTGEAPEAGTEEVSEQTCIDFTQGVLAQTDRPLDLAIDGKAFFELETPDGPLYTRNGTFRTNQEGQLVDFSGRTVAGAAGPIIIPSGVALGQVQVSHDGTISAAGQGIGRLKLVSFQEATQLEPIGGSCFRAPTDATPEADQTAAVHQGYREASNVSIVEELVELIMVTRLYEANISAMLSQDERMKTILQVAMA